MRPHLLHGTQLDRRAAGRRSSCFALCLLFLLAGLPASGQDSDPDRVIARIGDRQLTRGEFDEMFSHQLPPASADADSVKAEFLESLIHKELLVLEARERGMFGPDPEIDARLKEFEESLLKQRMTEEEAKIDSTVTEAEIVEAFERTLTEMRMRHILHWSEAALDSARRRIDAGEPFSLVATEVTVDQRTREEGGLLPWLTNRALIPEFREALAGKKVGEVVGPFESFFGWHLAVIDSLREREGADLESEREGHRSDILAERARARQLAFDLEYRERYNLEWDVDAIVSTVSEADSTYRSIEVANSTDALTIAERWSPSNPDLIFFKYDGGSYTAGDYHQMLIDEGLGMNWYRVQPGQVLATMRQTFHGLAQVMDARRRGFDQDPELRKRVELRHEELVVERFYNDEVMGDFATTEAEERKYWGDHREQFYTLEVFRYAYIQVDDAAVAQALVDKMSSLDWQSLAVPGESAAQFDSLRNEVATSGHLVDSRRDTGRRSPELCGAVPDVARAMQPGDVGHAVESDGVHTVFVLTQYEPEKLDPFERARDRVVRTLQNLHSEERLTALLASLEQKFGVERYPENLGLPPAG